MEPSKDKEQTHESKKLSYQLKSLKPVFWLFIIIITLAFFGFDIKGFLAPR